MQISASQVKELRERTGSGFMECKEALAEAGGDIEEAVSILRKKGLAAVSKRAHRATSEGLVGSYIHPGGRIGVLVEVNCETDFVARTAEFQQLVKDICMQVAATAPRFISREEVTEEVLAKEREIYRDQAARSGKPEKVLDKIVEGKMEKFYSEACLLEQPFVKDPTLSVRDLLAASAAKTGENMRIRRFCRFVLGEGAEG
jgi:elongation factor Ts